MGMSRIGLQFLPQPRDIRTNKLGFIPKGRSPRFLQYLPRTYHFTRITYQDSEQPHPRGVSFTDGPSDIP